MSQALRNSFLIKAFSEFLRTGATLALFSVASYAITSSSIKYTMKMEVQHGKGLPSTVQRECNLRDFFHLYIASSLHEERRRIRDSCANLRRNPLLA